ncbi:Major facilitator superfamily [Macrophomina phaseolina MS6]|uniref:Major facilitator superfamily n=1 Tax=Macrophomina phaseolina (strain MS6) TaxID=1126212 RepID=K2RL39_MACPH|nr:Major facilitator superfamily [Macrophomina phaseolina MS6]
MEGEEEEESEEKRFLPGGRGEDEDNVGERQLFTRAEEEAVVKRLDRRLVLFMGLLYMLSFLDRSNIGNAKIAGLSRDLSLSSNQYEWLLTAFYITYILFEWMTLMYRLIPPHIYIPLCVFSWGLLASLQSLSTSFVSLLILRALLGISEAAFGPGVPFYLSFFFRRDELAFRTGLFISAAPLSTSFASTLAWLITKLGEGGPWAPWRLLFLIEGFPSLFVAVWAWSFVPDSPGEARWLSKRQREVAVLRLRRESSGGEGAEKDEERERQRKGEGKRGVDLREVVRTLLDPKCYLTALMFFSCNVAFSSVPVFLPTIIQE